MDGAIRGRVLALEMLLLPTLAGSSISDLARVRDFIDQFDDLFVAYAAAGDGEDIKRAAKSAAEDLFARAVMLRDAAERFRGNGEA